MSIKIIKDDYKALKKETNQFLRMVLYAQKEHVYIQENQTKHKINSNNKRILKATVLLLLYNIVEAVINKILVEIIENINQSELSYVNAIANVQKAWIKLQCQDSLRSCDRKNFSSNMHKYLDAIINENPMTFETIGFRELVSGNADSENIKKACCEYGLIILRNCNALDIVKQKRNELAHGDAKFTEVGGNCTESELLNYRNAIYNHLDLILKNTEKYLENQKYRK